jgi:hypothetical protein
MTGAVWWMALSLARAADAPAPDACAGPLVEAVAVRAPELATCAPGVVEGPLVRARVLACAGRPVAFGLPHARATARGRTLRAALREATLLRAELGADAASGTGLSLEDAERRVLAGATCSTDAFDWYALGTRVRDPLDLETARVRLPAEALATRGSLEVTAAVDVLREHLDAFDACGSEGAGGAWSVAVEIGPDGRTRAVRAGASTVPDPAAACLTQVAHELRFAASGRLSFTVELDATLAGR